MARMGQRRITSGAAFACNPSKLDSNGWRSAGWVIAALACPAFYARRCPPVPIGARKFQTGDGVCKAIWPGLQPAVIQGVAPPSRRCPSPALHRRSGGLMHAKLLIDAIMRQTTVLIA